MSSKPLSTPSIRERRSIRLPPNHIHRIIILDGTAAGANHDSPLHNCPKGTSKTIGSIVRGFKIGVWKGMQDKFPDVKLCQRNYDEHVIRSENDLNQTRQCVINNLLNGRKDENYTGGGNE